MPGKIWFVGAGPGDPDLITVKGRALLERAGAILYAGSLVDPAAIRTIRDWDRLVICPRFGFESLEAFYRDEAAGPRLGEIRVPTLLVVAERDPMIAIDTVVPWLDHASDAVTIVRKRRGGHVAFPRDVGLLDESGGTIEEEIVRWVSPHLVSAVR